MLYRFQIFIGDDRYDTIARDSYLNFIRSYARFTDLLGHILVQVADDDYQGNTRIFFKARRRYGFLVIGWGSCSGCDAMEGCYSIDEVFELFNTLYNNIKWFNTLQEAKDYIADDVQRNLEYYYHENEWLDFKAQVLAVNG